MNKDTQEIDEPLVVTDFSTRGEVQLKDRELILCYDWFREDEVVEVVENVKGTQPEIKLTSHKKGEQTQSYEKELDMTATFYVSDCEGCVGITKSGVDVRGTTHYQGKRVVAVDPSVIPLGSTLEVTIDDWTFIATAQDVGGAIKNRKIDVLVSDRDKAIELGRQPATVKIIEWGG